MKTYRPINTMAFIVWVFFTSSLSWAGDGYHAFTDVNGRSINGQLMEFDAGSQVVTIKREDNKTCRTPLAVFSIADQQYIREQSLEKDFTYSVMVSAALEQLDHAGANHDTRYQAEYVKSLIYEVTLENQSTSLFEEIDIEYCIFYRQGEFTQHGTIFSHGVQYGRWKVDLMTPNSKHVLDTEAILIYDEEHSVTLFGSSGGARGEIRGIWMRAAVTLPHGNRIIRKFCSPDNISKSEDWSGTTILAGLNNGRGTIAAYTPEHE